MSVLLCPRCGTLPKLSLQYTNELESSSLLHNLRTSNFPATEQESSHIQHNILPNIDADISSISAKIRSLQDVFASLQQERDALITVQKTYRGLISPCRAVPRELWEQIFLYVHEDDQCGSEEFSVSDPSRSIWNMSKVCQTWRAIAVSLHSCWTKLRLQFPAGGKTEGNVQALEAALQRSGQHPLDVILISEYNPPNFEPSFRNRMLAMVHAESPRWRDVRLAEHHPSSEVCAALWPISHARIVKPASHESSPRRQFSGAAICFQPLSSAYESGPDRNAACGTSMGLDQRVVSGGRSSRLGRCRSSYAVREPGRSLSQPCGFPGARL